MKLKEYIESLNDKMPANLSNYKITVERIVGIFKLNIDEKVVKYTSLLESELIDFKPNFFYYTEYLTKDCYLYAHQTNKNGEVSKIRLGTLSFYNNDLKTLGISLHNYRFKKINKALKKALGIKPQQGKVSSYHILISKEFEYFKKQVYFSPTKVDSYEYLFTDENKKILTKDEAYIASDYAIKNNLGIKSISKYSKYVFEKSVEQIIF